VWVPYISGNKRLDIEYKIQIYIYSMIRVESFELVDNSPAKIKLYFTYLGEETMDIKIFAKDYCFNTVGLVNDMTVEAGGYYWVVFDAKGLENSNVLFQTGLNLVFYKQGENEQFAEELLFKPIVNSFQRHRTDKPSLWVIGDSHTGYSLKSSNLMDESIGRYSIEYTSQYELSLNRFLCYNGSRASLFVDTIPIQIGDRIAISLGEIDIRYSILNKAPRKGKSPEEILDEILDRYLLFLKTLKERYFLCDISVFIPSPQLRDGVISPDSYTFPQGTQEERLMLHRQFVSRMSSDLPGLGVDLHDPYKEYRDEEGFMLAKYSVRADFSFDHHVNDGRPLLEFLKNLE